MHLQAFIIHGIYFSDSAGASLLISLISRIRFRPTTQTSIRWYRLARWLGDLNTTTRGTTWRQSLGQNPRWKPRLQLVGITPAPRLRYPRWRANRPDHLPSRPVDDESELEASPQSRSKMNGAAASPGALPAARPPQMAHAVCGHKSVQFA
jgi:hypothetical protein